MQNDLVQLRLNGISCDFLICCRDVHRHCGLTVDVILVSPFTCKMEEIYIIWFELNSHCSALNLVLS